MQERGGLLAQPLLTRVGGMPPALQRIEQRRDRALSLHAVPAEGQQLHRQQLAQVALVAARPVLRAAAGKQLAEGLVETRPFGSAAVEDLAVKGGGDLCLRVLSVRLDRVGQGRSGEPQLRRRVVDAVGGARRQQRQGLDQRGEIAGQRLGRRPQPGQRIDRGRVVGMHAPEVGGEFLMQLALAGQQGRWIEGMSALQGMLTQHAGAEAMDGENRGEVDFIGRGLQPARQRSRGFFTERELALQDHPGQGDLRAVLVARHALHQLCGQGQALADALAQFLRGSIGEGDGQDLADAPAFLHHQPGEQRGQGKGLAGPRAGLDQAHAVQRQRQVGIVKQVVVDHRRAPSSSKPGNTRPSRTAVNTTKLLCSSCR